MLNIYVNQNHTEIPPLHTTGATNRKEGGREKGKEKGEKGKYW